MTATATADLAAYVIMCDGDVDQICYSKREADKEVRDLKKMGFDRVSAKKFDSAWKAEEYADKKRGY